MHIEKVADLHQSLAQVDDTASELILLRMCADVCKIVHLLRTAGPAIEEEALELYDETVQKALIRCLGGQLDQFALRQSSLGVTERGLGMRRAIATAVSSYLSSRIECR